MSYKIRIATKAELFEKRKQELREAGYEIEAEQPVSANGLCSLTVVQPDRDSESG
jgi:hypothetical protein